MPDETIIESTLNQALADISPEFMDKVSKLAASMNLTVGQVHFSLLSMIADDVGDNSEEYSTVTVALISFQTLMYRVATGRYFANRKVRSN